MARTPTTPTQPGSTSREDEILMREIDEAVRQDDTLAFFKRYGTALGVAVALLILGMLAYWWWESSREAELEAQSEAIISALDSVDADDFAGAQDKVAGLVDDGSVGARTVARFLQAGTALEQGEESRAVELYATIAADSETPEPLRDLALIREVATDFDRLEPSEVIAKLEGMAVPGHPWFGSAGELVAIAHLEAGNRKEAGTLFSQIAQDENLPDTLRNRSRQMAGLLGVDAIEDVEELLESQGLGATSGAGAQGAAPPPSAPPQG